MKNTIQCPVKIKFFTNKNESFLKFKNKTLLLMIAISYHYFYSAVICSCNLHPKYSATRVETFHSTFCIQLKI